MMLDPDLPNLFDIFLSHTEEAITIARRVTIGTYIADAQVIAATPAAAAWYGLDEVTHLVGRWMSLLHHPEDNRLARTLAAARHSGLPVPTAYVSRIWQADAPGTFRAVHKHTLQFTRGVETYWITRLVEPQDSPLILHKDVQQYFHLSSTQTALQFLGKLSVADVEQVLQKNAGGLEVEGEFQDASDTSPLLGEDLSSATPRAPSVRYQSTRPNVIHLLGQGSHLQNGGAPHVKGSWARRGPAGVTPLSLSQHVRRLRQIQGFTQKALAQRAGVTAVTISRLEQSGDTSHVTIDTVVRLAQALDVRLETLLGLDDKPSIER